MFQRQLKTDLTLKAFAEIIGAKLPAELDDSAVCGRILTQSVYVQPGEVVISAGWYPHKQTITEALAKGALAIFCDREWKAQFGDSRVVAVDDPKACVTLFENWRATFGTAKRVAITGSVGKTTTTGLINSVIANSFNTLTHHSMSNSHGAVLRNVQRLEPEHEWWVQEIGGVQPGYVESTAVFLRPDVVVLTNIGESHLNLYGTKENILWDKGSLERYAQPDGVVIINHDDEILRNAKYSHRVISCSLKDPSADYYADDFRTELDGLHFTINCKDGKYRAHLNLYGDYNAYNALFAAAVGQLAGLDMPRIVELLTTYYPSGMRQNLVQVGGYKLFVDAFNAEPKTVLGSAQTLTQMPVGEKGRRIFVTGHIDKIGEKSAQMHAELGHELAKLDLDKIVLFAGDSEHTYKSLVADGFPNAHLMGSREELDDWLRTNVTRDDVVFFKSGQFAAALVKSVDHVFGTTFQNEQQFNEGRVVEKDGYKFRIRQDNIAEVIGYTGKDTVLTIPSTYEDNMVIRIAPRAFSEKRFITSVTIPDSVTTIGQEAFYICPRLKEVKLPAKLRYIGKNAFNYCKALEQVELPADTIHVDRRAFYDCVNLRSVKVPESVGFLGEAVFGMDNAPKTRALVVACPQGSYAETYAKEEGLATQHWVAEEKVVTAAAPVVDDRDAIITKGHVLLEEMREKDVERVLQVMVQRLARAGKLEEILKGYEEKRTKGYAGVNNVSAAEMTKELFVQDLQGATLDYTYDITADGVIITAGSTQTATLDIPMEIEGKPLTSIGRSVFRGNRKLKELTIYGNLNSIQYLAFCSCINLEKVSIFGTVSYIGRSVFNSCKALKEIVLPEGTRTIGQMAFAGCDNLQRVQLPDSLKEIAPDAFQSCPQVVISCSKGSYAEQYAEKNNIPFVFSEGCIY